MRATGGSHRKLTPRSPKWGCLGSAALVLVAAAVAVVLSMLTSVAPPAQWSPNLSPEGGDGTAADRGDFETGGTSQFDLECPHSSRQLSVVTSPVRQGRFAARFETAPGDNWVNGSIRCLAALYRSGEGDGDDYYYAFSMFFPEAPADNLLWELHSPKAIYSVHPNTSVSPHAVCVVGGRLEYRLGAGPAMWNGTTWTGWSTYEPDIVIARSVPVARWIDLVVHIKFSHNPDGLVEVWYRDEGGAWPVAPTISRYGVPTLQWIPGYTNEVRGIRNDPNVGADIRTTALYTELGLYKGSDVTTTTDVVYHDGFRRGRTKEAVMAEFPA